MPVLTATFIVEKSRGYSTNHKRHALASLNPNNNASYGVGFHATAECKEDDFHATVEYNRTPDCEACLKVLKEKYAAAGIPWPE
jgi:hypothetical protein